MKLVTNCKNRLIIKRRVNLIILWYIKSPERCNDAEITTNNMLSRCQSIQWHLNNKRLCLNITSVTICPQKLIVMITIITNTCHMWQVSISIIKCWTEYVLRRDGNYVTIYETLLKKTVFRWFNLSSLPEFFILQ